MKNQPKDGATQVPTPADAEPLPDDQMQPSNSETAKDTAKEVMREVQVRGKEVAGKAVDEAKETARRFRRQAASSLDDSKAQLTSQIGSVAQALRRGGNQFRDDDLGQLAQGSEWLADQVAQVQTYLHEQDGQALLGDLTRIVKRRPALLLGGLFVTSALAVAYLQSAEERKKQGAPLDRSEARVSRDTGDERLADVDAGGEKAARHPRVVVTREKR
jgi:hypothetical protein